MQSVKLKRIAGFLLSARVILFLTLLATSYIYFDSIGFDYNIDDGMYFDKLVSSEYVSLFDALKVFKDYFNYFDYRPVTAFLLVLEQVFLGRQAGVFHLFNIFYYCLLFFVLYQTFKQFEIFPNSSLLALFIMIFAVHPSHAEVVSSIKNRDIIIASILALTGARFLYKSFTIKGKPLKKGLFFMASFILAYLTFITKTDAIFIYAIPLIIFFFNRTFSIKQFAGFFVSLIIILYFARYLLFLNLDSIDTASQAQAVGYFENPLKVSNDIFSIIEMQFKALFHYLKFQFYPTDYLFYYGYNMIPLNGFWNYKFIIGCLVFIGLILFVIYSYTHKKYKLLSIGAAIFMVLMLPYLIFISNVAGIIAVRYGFYASIGTAIIITVFIYQLFQKNKFLGIGIGLTIVIFSIITSRNRCLDWRSQETLYARDMPKLKDSYIANRMYGNYFFQTSNFSQNSTEVEYLMDKARVYFYTAYQLYQDDPVLLRLIGNSFLREEQADSAKFYFIKAAEADPNNAESWKQMADYALVVNDYEKVVFYANKILELDKGNADAMAYVNNILTTEAKWEELIAFNQKMIQQNPHHYLPYLYQAKVYQAQNNRPLAMINYFEAFMRGFEDDRLKNSLVQYAIGQNYQEIIRNYPMFFE
jgi:hypothetical protein